MSADRVRHRRQLVPSLPGAEGAFTAASRVLTPTLRDEPQSAPWHAEAWSYRRTTGEVRFAELWLANSMAQAKLIAAYRPDPKADPVPIEDGPAADLIAALGDGAGGQAKINAAFGVQLLTPGVGYLIGQPGIENASDWKVVSANQIRLSARRVERTGEPLYELKEGEDARDWRVLEPGSLPVKVWRPDPEYDYLPSSPVQGALPILRELSLLTQHVEAQATSRLAGAGILAIDGSIELEGTWEAFLTEFLKTVVTPIRDRSVPAAVAPFPMKFATRPGEKVADKLHHLLFATPFDEQSLKLRAEAIGRLATAMDMPTRMLLGEAENHWGDWHTSDQGIKLHVDPDMQLVCEGITRGYLTPGLQAVTNPSREQGLARVIELRNAPPPMYQGYEVFCWYDTSALGQRPDVSQAAKDAYDRFEADGDTLRRESGLDDVAPKGPELERQVWLSMLHDPAMAPLALLKLGLATEDEIQSVKPAPVAVTPPPDDPEDEIDDQGEPDTQDDAPPPAIPSDGQRAASVNLALVAAADGLVHRALEKAGNRLRQAMRKAPGGAPDCAAVVAHTECNAGAWVDATALLDGAWDRVPEVAAQLDLDAEQLARHLDYYVRGLIRSRRQHSWELLAAWLTAADNEAAA